MRSNTIFQDRKKVKASGHAVVRSHLVVLIFLSLVLTFFGTEITFTTTQWEHGFGPLYARTDKDGLPDPGSVFTLSQIFPTSEVWDDIVNGRLNEGMLKSNNLLQKLQSSSKSAALGRTNGVLAQIVNSFGSGGVIIVFSQMLRSLTRSDEMVPVLMMGGYALFYLLVFMFLLNVMSAAVRRLFLEARVYENVPFHNVLFFAGVRKWKNASVVMMVKYICFTLWSFTIIGGVIKWFSYFAVPYIVAENPDISARDALTLSRKMMDGHKFELFKFMLTFIGWILLGIVTFGVSDLIYGNAYRMACYSEFYARVREEAIEKGVEGTELLFDKWLFMKADRILLYETYFDVIDEITLIHEDRIELKGWRRFIAEWFSIWAGSLKEKKAYDEQEGRLYMVDRYRKSMAGESYPLRLNPMWKKMNMAKTGHFTFLRHYTVWTLILLFITFSFVGWSWEVLLHYIQMGSFANRGTLHGPWLPIYGSGGVVALLVCSRFRKNPVAEFFASIVVCGALEYLSGWYLETKYHQRWWSYDGYFLNLHGRICAEGLLVFGVGCCMVVYLLAPVFDFLVSKIRQQVLIGLCVVLLGLYIGDVVYSSENPNMAEGAIEADWTDPSTVSSVSSVPSAGKDHA